MPAANANIDVRDVVAKAERSLLDAFRTMDEIAVANHRVTTGVVMPITCMLGEKSSKNREDFVRIKRIFDLCHVIICIL